MNHLWERVKTFVGERPSRVRSDSQVVQGEVSDVWQWIKDHSKLSKKNGKVRSEYFAQVRTNPSASRNHRRNPRKKITRPHLLMSA